MAKRGGTSEVNGFVNIKTEDASRTKQKVSSRNTGATTNTKINTSKNTMKDEIDDKNLKAKRLTNKDSPEAKKVPNNSASKISKSTVSSSSKTNVQTSKDISKTHKEPSKPLKEPSKPLKEPSKTLKEPSKTHREPSKTLKSTNDSTKDRLHKDKGIDKTKTINSTPQPRISTGQNISSRKVEIKDGSKSKQTSSSTSQKGTTLVANKNAEKIQKVSSKESKIIKIPNDKDNKDRKTKLEDSKGERSKALNQTKRTTDPKRIVEKDATTNKNATSRSNVLSKNSNGSLLKQKTSKTTKPISKEKEKKNVNEEKAANQEASRKIGSFSETVVSEMKVELPKEDLRVKSSYKDLIYFEVDMGNAEQPSKSRTRSARMKSATSEPPPISRQGTFTKDESSTSLEQEAQITKEVMSEEKPTTIQDDSEEVEYEDDFEDYESDFEEYVSESDSESGLSSKSETESEPVEIQSSKNQQVSKPLRRLSVKTVEEERKLDSGNYELSSKPAFPPTLKQKQLDLIKEAITRENTSLFDKRKITPEELASEENNAVTLDFLTAFKKKEDTKKAESGKQRSSMILQMINLHEQKIDLFEEIFSDDDLFQNIYQNRNVNHMFTETELVLKEEGTQTYEIKIQNKWTQYPISYHPWSENFFNLKTFLEDQRGFGGDNIITDYNIWWNVKYNTKKLYNFIDTASKVVLIMLEEEARWRYDEEKSVSVAKDDLGFSEGCIPIQVANVSFLKTRPICDIRFSPHDSNVFISSHRFLQDLEKLSSFTDQFFGRSILCVWSILEPSQPLYILVASCQISAVSFDSEYDNFIYAGLTDGSICLWDLNESSMYHKETTAGSMGYLLRTPTFCTSHLAGKDYHHNVIVSVKSLGYETLGRLSQNFNPTQILTLDADGKVVLWIVTRTLSYLEKTEKNVDQFDSGISYWGKFKLVMGKTLNPENALPSSENKWGLQFLCMSLAPEYNTKNKTSIKSILVGTNVGNIVHFYASEDDIDVPVFSNESGEKYAFSVMCLERNPHGYPVFLAGCNDGKIRFYVLDKPKPFKIVSSDGDFVVTPVNQIRWSPLGQGLFFALDINFCLHFWDICKGDHSPQKTISLKKLQAAHFDLTHDKKFVYIGLSVKRVKIDIHRLKEKFITVKSDEEREFFTQFVKCNSKLLDKI